MQEKRRKVILSTRQELTPNDFVERAEREGIELEKGAVITNEYLERHYDDLCKWVSLFTAYPDYYLGLHHITSKLLFLLSQPGVGLV